MLIFVCLLSLAGGAVALPLMRRTDISTWIAGIIVLGVVAGPLYWSIEAPITSLSLDRILMVLTAALLAIQWRSGRLQSPDFGRQDAVLVALVIWLLVRTIGVAAPEGESPPLTRWLTFVAMPAMLYAMVRVTRLSVVQVRRIMNAFLAMGGYLSVIAILEVSGRHGWVYPAYIVDATNWEFLGRARGPLLNPTANGVVLTSTLAIASHRWLHAARTGRIGYLLLIGLIGCGVLFTLTRSVWMGSMLLACVLSMVYLPRWTRVLALTSCVLLGGLAMSGAGEQIFSMKRDKELSASDAAKSVELRPLLAIVAWEMFRDRPLIGHGFGGYFDASPRFHTIRTYGLPLEEVRPYMQHNVLMSLAVDTGLIGLTLFVVWLVTIVAMAWRLMNAPADDATARSIGIFTIGVVCGYFVNGMFHDVSAMPMLNNLLLLAGAMTMTQSAAATAPRAATITSRRPATDRRGVAGGAITHGC